MMPSSPSSRDLNTHGFQQKLPAADGRQPLLASDQPYLYNGCFSTAGRRIIPRVVAHRMLSRIQGGGWDESVPLWGLLNEES